MSGTFKNGKSKKRMVTDILTMMVTQDPNLIKRLLSAQFIKAHGGDTAAATLLIAYLDGKPHQSIDMDLDITGSDTETKSDHELTKALRDRMAGILPKRTVSGVEGGGGEGTGGDKKTH